MCAINRPENLASLECRSGPGAVRLHSHASPSVECHIQAPAIVMYPLTAPNSIRCGRRRGFLRPLILPCHKVVGTSPGGAIERRDNNKRPLKETNAYQHHVNYKSSLYLTRLPLLELRSWVAGLMEYIQQAMRFALRCAVRTVQCAL